MTLHILKLSVGSDSVSDLADWQANYASRQKKAGHKPRLMHITRMTPKRQDEVLDGGSIYWVVKGYTAVRQRILALEPVTRDGVPHCGIVYDPHMVPVARRAQRPFQGWRYLDPKAAPEDLPQAALDLPPDLRDKLSELGLL